MFNKKTRRNFRQRKEASSEEEDDAKNNKDEEEISTEAAPIKKPLHAAQSRGLSCSSKREEAPLKRRAGGEEAGETEESKDAQKDGIKKKSNTVLSFSDDKEGNGDKVNLYSFIHVHYSFCIKCMFTSIIKSPLT